MSITPHFVCYPRRKYTLWSSLSVQDRYHQWFLRSMAASSRVVFRPKTVLILLSVSLLRSQWDGSTRHRILTRQLRRSVTLPIPASGRKLYVCLIPWMQSQGHKYHHRSCSPPRSPPIALYRSTRGRQRSSSQPSTTQSRHTRRVR
jgi:hypothetical protein